MSVYVTGRGGDFNGSQHLEGSVFRAFLNMFIDIGGRGKVWIMWQITCILYPNFSIFGHKIILYEIQSICDRKGI
jgi:hypothetical protein